MLSEILTKNIWVESTLVSFAIFFILYIIFVAKTFKKGTNDSYKDFGNIPLQEAKIVSLEKDSKR